MRIRQGRIDLAEVTYFHEVKRGVSEACEARGWTLDVRFDDFDAEAASYDAVLAAVPARQTASARRLRRLEDRTRVIHLTVPPAWPDARYVGTDEKASLRKLVEHLHREGRRRLVYLAVSGSAWSEARADAFREALHAFALRADDAVLRGGTPHWPPDGRARALFRKLTALSPLPDAVVCESDLLAAPLWEHLQKSGIAVPDRLALGGFDDAEVQVTGRGAHALTTIRQDYRGLGRAAVDMADGLFAGRLTGRGHRALLPGMLLPRFSTRSAPRGFEAAARELLARHLDEDELVRLLAGRFEVQPRTLRLRFFRETGARLAHEIARLRVERAAERLAAGEGNVTDVFLRSGFRTRQHFHAAFRRFAGRTPRSFLREGTEPGFSGRAG